MILSDRDIRRAFAAGRIQMEPSPDLTSSILRPCSVDFHLGNTFRVFDYNKLPIIDPLQELVIDTVTRLVEIPDGERFIIHPGELIIAATRERLTLSNDLIGRLEGRSSLARVGIIVHSTAARFDPGWDGNPMLELGNQGRIPVALYPGMRICSFTFEELSSPVEFSYQQKGRFKQQTGQTSTKFLPEDFQS
ncbi:dCTP deaminase [Candidatus Uhrbacteria bacterium]|nr:dCTP deaminase [Candidatus Uhrbacteria bacterium]